MCGAFVLFLYSNQSKVYTPCPFYSAIHLSTECRCTNKLADPLPICDMRLIRFGCLAFVVALACLGALLCFSTKWICTATINHWGLLHPFLRVLRDVTPKLERVVASFRQTGRNRINGIINKCVFICTAARCRLFLSLFYPQSTTHCQLIESDCGSGIVPKYTSRHEVEGEDDDASGQQHNAPLLHCECVSCVPLHRPEITIKWQ